MCKCMCMRMRWKLVHTTSVRMETQCAFFIVPKKKSKRRRRETFTCCESNWVGRVDVALACMSLTHTSQFAATYTARLSLSLSLSRLRLSFSLSLSFFLYVLWGKNNTPRSAGWTESLECACPYFYVYC